MYYVSVLTYSMKIRETCKGRSRFTCLAKNRRRQCPNWAYVICACLVLIFFWAPPLLSQTLTVPLKGPAPDIAPLGEAEKGAYLEVQTPNGWHLYGTQDGLPANYPQLPTFLPNGRSKKLLLNQPIELSFDGGVEVLDDIKSESFRKNPRNGEAATHYGPGTGQTFTVRKIETFDGKQNGKLTLWRLRKSYDTYDVIMTSGPCWAELWLRCDDSKLLKQCLNVLKGEARTLRIVRPNKSVDKESAARIKR